MRAVEISVVIPTHSRSDLLREALSSLGRVSSGRAWEVVVVDNSPNRALGPAREEALPNGVPVRYVWEKRQGLHFGRHAGAYAARAPIVAYIDDDVRVSPGWLDGVAGAFVDPEVGAMGGKIEPLWLSEPPEWVKEQPSGYLSLMDLGPDPLVLSWPQDIYGCNMAFRRSVILDLGGFHPDGYADPELRWFRGDGETGFIRKVYGAGWKIVYRPEALLQHTVPASRLTPEYFEKRATMQGVSDSFSVSRDRGALAGALRTIAGALRRWLRLSLGRSRSKRHSVTGRTERAYVRGLVGHSFRLLLSPGLRHHVARPSFLDSPPEED